MITKLTGLFILFFITLGCGRKIMTTAGEKRENKKLNVFAGFERGAIGEVKYADSDSIVLASKHWKKLDGIGDQYYWFNFALSPVKSKRVTVVVNGLTGIYRGGLHEVFTDFTYPVFSYNNIDWQRIPGVRYDKAKKSFSFSHLFEKDTVWLAYAHPYLLKRLEALKAEFRSDSNIVIKTLGASKEGRPMNLFSVSNYSVAAKEKKVAVIISLQHSGEDAGAYVSEGMIRFLVSGSKSAQAIRKKWIVHVVPVMNPDGLFHGITRYNAYMEDLNSIWLKSNDSLQSGPEVSLIRNWLDKQFESSLPPSVFFDIHSHSQQIPFNDMFSDDSTFHFVAEKAIRSGFPLRFSIRKVSNPGASTSYLVQKYHIPSALIELTQSYVNDKRYLTISDYERYGELLIQALDNSFN